MYYLKKSDLLNKVRQIQGAVVELMKGDRSAVVFDLFVVINALANRKSIKPKTIGEFCYKNIYGEISKRSKRCARIDIVKNLYPVSINLKEMTQHRRGIGMHVEFDNNTPFPINFASDFLRRSEKKCKFYPYLVNSSKIPV